MSDALTTVDRMRSRLTLTVDGFDDLLESLILAVTARIETMCGQRFIQAEYTNELHDGSDLYGSRRSILIPKSAPIQVIDSIEYKSGSNSDPAWYAFSEDDYDLDADAGLVYFKTPLPRGKRNIRITYTAGYSGYSIGLSNFWFFNQTPTGTVDGANLTFTLPETASQVIVYADGLRIAASNVVFTEGTASFTLAADYAPFTTIAIDYLRETASTDSDITLPLDLVEVCEEVVTRIFKKRDSEGRSSEGFEASAITYDSSYFKPEDLTTIANYRRSYAQ